jgi:glycine hydroxymethyltransferase
MNFLSSHDPEVCAAINDEAQRQQEGLELIASENYTSPAVMEAVGSVLTNKYAEGYPGRRYYGGCEFADVVEDLARDRAKELFGAEYANVQPSSGSQANQAVYLATGLEPGDTVMGLDLAHGGHLTHGMHLNLSGKLYNFVHYGVTKDTHLLDFDQIASLALVAAGEHDDPVAVADFVSTTTHKTLRGPRGGLVLCKKKWAKKINSAVFPGMQGGPLMHVVAGKAVCFGEGLKPEFKTYAQQVKANAKVLGDELMSQGFSLVSGGTDNHLCLVDVTSLGIGGKIAEETLDKCGITLNKNMIPYDERSPMDPSGIRIGTPALTTRGMGVDQMKQVAAWIHSALSQHEDAAALEGIRKEVAEMCENFPVPAAAMTV